MDTCLQAFQNNLEIRKMQWIGQYRATQNNIPAPMILLTIQQEPTPVETYWKPILEVGAQFIAIWGNRVLYSRIKNDAVGLGYAQAGDNPEEVMDVYEINPTWWMLCLDAKPGTRYVKNISNRKNTQEEFSVPKNKTDEFQHKVEMLRQELIASNSNETEDLGRNLVKFNTLASEKSDEIRKSLLDSEHQLNTKNRYLEIMYEENNARDILFHALIAFFFVLAMCVLPVIAYYTGLITTAHFFGIIVVIFILYVIYIVYIYRQQMVHEYIKPQYNEIQHGLQNVSNYLQKTAAEVDSSITQYVNDNCSCPSDMDVKSAVDEITGQSKGRVGTPSDTRTNYLPKGQVFSERGAPYQMIDPVAQSPSKFTIRWQDIWTKANQLPIRVDDTVVIFEKLGLSFDSSVAQNQLTSQQLVRIIQTAQFINGFSKNNQSISPVEYVYFVMLFIYRDKHIVSQNELAEMTDWFLNQNFDVSHTAGCGLIHHIMASGSFKLTFGSPSMWITYACSHPFYPGAQLQRHSRMKNL